MQLALPKCPSSRDLQIYNQVHTEHRVQAEIAQEHELSQQRVAQIVAEVGKWIGTAGPYTIETTEYEQQYVAARNSRMMLEFYERWLFQVCDQQTKPLVLWTEKKPDKPDGEMCITRQNAKHGKVDAKLVQFLFELRPKVLSAQETERSACRQARKNQPKSKLMMEEREVMLVLRGCRRLQRHIGKMRKAGADIPKAPRWNRRRIEGHARAGIRGNPNYAVEDLVLPEWQEADRRVFPDGQAFAKWLEEGEGERENAEWLALAKEEARRKAEEARRAKEAEEESGEWGVESGGVEEVGDMEKVSGSEEVSCVQEEDVPAKQEEVLYPGVIQEPEVNKDGTPGKPTTFNPFRPYKLRVITTQDKDYVYKTKRSICGAFSTVRISKKNGWRCWHDEPLPPGYNEHTIFQVPDNPEIDKLIPYRRDKAIVIE